jgi:hypothetical protein
MKLLKLTLISIAMALSVNLSAVAEDDHLEQATKHAEEAADATDAAGVVKHAQTAQTHAKTASDHIASGMKALDSAVEHGNLGHTEMAKGAAKEAVKHFKAADD